MNEDIGSEGNDYRQILDKSEMTKGVQIRAPGFQGETSTVVTAILRGDALPFTHLIQHDEFAFLCLPDNRPLARIDEVIKKAASNRKAMTALLSKGGFAASVVDLSVLTIHTLDSRFSHYFTLDE